jgi:hypothetical protein
VGYAAAWGPRVIDEDGASAPVVRLDRDLPVPGAEGDDHGLTCLQLLEECKKERERQWPLIEEALIREACVIGAQWSTGNQAADDVISEINDRALVTENLLYPLCLTYDARLNQGRIEPRAFASQPERGDVSAAEAAQMILDYEKQRNAVDRICHDATILAQMHGDVLFYPTWSLERPARVRRQKVTDVGEPMFDAQGQPIMEDVDEAGGVLEEIISAPDYWTSGEERYEDASYVCVARLPNKHRAVSLLKRAGFANPDVAEVPARGSVALSGIERKGVETYELWWRPGDRFARGVYGLVVGGYVVQCIEYPLDHNDLPGAVFKIGTIPRCPRGKTHVSDAIHQQRIINASLRSILRRTAVAADVYTIGPSMLLQQMRGGEKRVESDSVGSGKIEIVNGPDVPKSLFDVYALAKQAIYDTFGVSETSLTGGNPQATKSGRQLEIQNANDAQKIVAARRNLEDARLRVDRQKLRLWQQFAEDAQLVRVIGPGGIVAARWLSRAEIMGADVTLEIGSGTLTSRIGEQRAAEEAGAAGHIPPPDAAERRETGLRETVGRAEMRARIAAQAQAAMRGEQQTPMPGVDPRLAAAELLLWVGASADAPREGRMALLQLVAAYEDAAAAAAKSQQAMQHPRQAGLKPTETLAKAREAMEAVQ